MVNAARIKLGLITVLCLALVVTGFLVAKPKLLDEHAIRNALVDQLSAWSGATVAVNGMSKISYFPRLLVQTDDVQITGIRDFPAIDKISARHMEIRLGLWSLVSGRPVVDRVTFVLPVIEANANWKASKTRQDEATGGAFFDAITNAPFEQIVIDQGTITVTGPTAVETFADVTAKIGLESSGSHVARGSFAWRKQKLSFNYEGGTPEKLSNAARIPVSLSISGELVSAEIEGQATLNDSVRTDGELQLHIPSLPQFARWTGVLVPEDQKRGDFSANGAFHWSGHRIGFDEGSFLFDGNRALGALALDFGGPRPKIDGTLALQRLDLSQYFKNSSAAEPVKAAPSTSQPKTVDLDFPVLHHINFDLRISTADLIAEPVRLGQSALSVTLEAGKLVADVAVFELCGGSVNGRIELDATVPDSAIRLSTSMTGISARKCIEMFVPSSPLEGTADVTADVTTSGRTAMELLESLRGKASVAIAAGSMTVNVSNLLAQVRKGPVDGWTVLSSGNTAFKLLKGDIFLRPRAVYTDSLMIDLGSGRIAGEGIVDFATRTLDLAMDYSAADPAASPETQPKEQSLRRERFVIKGPWSQPTFSPGPEKSSARAAPKQDNMQTARQAN